MAGDTPALRRAVATLVLSEHLPRCARLGLRCGLNRKELQRAIHPDKWEPSEREVATRAFQAYQALATPPLPLEDYVTSFRRRVERYREETQVIIALAVGRCQNIPPPVAEPSELNGEHPCDMETCIRCAARGAFFYCDSCSRFERRPCRSCGKPYYSASFRRLGCCSLCGDLYDCRLCGLRTNVKSAKRDICAGCESKHRVCALCLGDHAEKSDFCATCRAVRWCSTCAARHRAREACPATHAQETLELRRQLSDKTELLKDLRVELRAAHEELSAIKAKPATADLPTAGPRRATKRRLSAQGDLAPFLKETSFPSASASFLTLHARCVSSHARRPGYSKRAFTLQERSSVRSSLLWTCKFRIKLRGLRLRVTPERLREGP